MNTSHVVCVCGQQSDDAVVWTEPPYFAQHYHMIWSGPLVFLFSLLASLRMQNNVKIVHVPLQPFCLLVETTNNMAKWSRPSYLWDRYIPVRHVEWPVKQTRITFRLISSLDVYWLFCLNDYFHWPSTSMADHRRVVFYTKSQRLNIYTLYICYGSTHEPKSLTSME